MSGVGSKNADAARDWAEKRREALERARRLREERARGRVSDEHTFKPTCVRAARSPPLPAPPVDPNTRFLVDAGALAPVLRLPGAVARKRGRNPSRDRR